MQIKTKEDGTMNRILNFVVLVFCFVVVNFFTVEPVFSEGRQVISGPLSFTLRGGGENDSATVGLDARMDYLNPILNAHIFGTYDLRESGNGIGEIDNQRYGAGLALSHTFPGRVNIFAGTAFINEMSEYFGHAYLGGKIKVTDFALISGSYGFGFKDEKEIVIRDTSHYLLAESADWAKLGVVLVAQNGLKTNLYYYLASPGDLNISGVEGEVSYPVTNSITVGINGSSDLTTNTNLENNWKTYLFLTYSFGQQKGSPIDVALDKNNPIAYPKIVRMNMIRKGEVVESKKPKSKLTISPTNASAEGCYTNSVIFTANGGTQPYSWSASEGSLSVNGTQATWTGGDDTEGCYMSRTVTVTVIDSAEDSASATIDVYGDYTEK